MTPSKKVAVMIFSGKVGKTAVAAHLLKPCMGDAPIFSIESINAGANAQLVDVEKMRGKKFGTPGFTGHMGAGSVVDSVSPAAPWNAVDRDGPMDRLRKLACAKQ